MSDDYFKKLAQKKQKEEQERKEHGDFQFEDQHWTGFSGVGESKIIRFVDPMLVTSPDDLKTKNMEGELIFNSTSARTVNLVTLYDDNKNKRYMYVPDKREDKGHIFWRLVDTVMAFDYVDKPGTDEKERVYLNAESHGKLFDRFKTNGYGSKVHKNKFDRGWKPQKMLIANVIDRACMDKHREIKHTMLLSKNVNEWEGKVYYDKGVPAYGLVDDLLDTVAHYGPLNSYDLYINRVGKKEQGFKLRNAGVYTLEVEEELHPFISTADSLTEEELSWERYDIETLFGYSSATKWFNGFKKLIKEVDIAFNKNFHDELEELANQEKEERAKLKEKGEAKTTVTKTREVTKEEAPTTVTTQDVESTTEATEAPRARGTRSSSTSEPIAEISWAYLKSLDTNNEWIGEEVFEANKHLIEGIGKGTSGPEIIWKNKAEGLLCSDGKGDKPACSLVSPEEVTGCIKCGEIY